MPTFEDLFPSITYFFVGFDQTIALIVLLVILFSSIIYVIVTLKHLKRVFKHRDHSFKQNFHIVYSIAAMLFLSYIVYEILKIILT